MAASRKEFHLNDKATFYIRKYEPFLALEILGELQTKFLAPLAAFMESADEKTADETKTKYVMDGIERLSRNLDGKELVKMAKMLLNGEYISVSIDNEPAEKLSEHLLNRGVEDVSELAELVIEVIKENFANVFTRGQTLIGKGRSSIAQ
jgi:hypothetical protein